jgi:hypothetical protein
VEAVVPLPPPPEDIKTLATAAPVMPGAEYLTADVLTSLWAELGAAFLVELAESKVTVQEFLKSLHPAWNVVGRVHFNLAENRKDEDAPFAFLAPTRTGFLRMARPSTCRLDRRCATTRALPAKKSCSRCCCRFSARRNPVRG